MNLPVFPNKQFRKEAYNCIAPELVCNTVTPFTLSFNPIDTYQYVHDDNRLVLFDKHWRKQFQTLFKINVCHVELYTEVSKLGRLHYHGYVIIKDIARFYLEIIPKMKLLGTFEIDHLTDKLKWDVYCRKQSHLFKPLLKIYPYKNEYTIKSKGTFV